VLFRRNKAAPQPPPIRYTAPLEPRGFFSSGIPDLDGILGGGYRPGCVFAIEGDASTRSEDFFLISLPSVLSFLAHGRGALVVPPSGVAAAWIRNRAVRYVSEENFDTRVRVPDYTAIDLSAPWLVPMARFGRSEAMRAMISAERAVSGNPRGPYIELLAVDALESSVGPEVTAKMLTYGFTRTKEFGNLAIAWLRSSSAARDVVVGTADGHLALSRDSRGTTVRGIKPELAPRLIEWTEANGELRVSLGLPS